MDLLRAADLLSSANLKQQAVGFLQDHPLLVLGAVEHDTAEFLKEFPEVNESIIIDPLCTPYLLFRSSQQ